MTDLDRRKFLSGSAAAVASAQSVEQAFAQGAGAPSDLSARLTYPFSVPALPYPYEANEPSIDAQTMRLHHDKHHLSLVAKANQDSPLTEGLHPVFGNDVWEHAYYLKYQNRRADYLAAWWNVLDWPRIGERYAAAKAGTLSI